MNEQIVNIKFVREVEKRPCLYNYKLPGYSRRDITDRAWMEVANEVQMTVGECKDKWKNIRAVFVRNRKRFTSGRKPIKKPYYLLDKMQFVVPFIKVLNNDATNGFDGEEEENNESDDTEEDTVLQYLAANSGQPPISPTNPHQEENSFEEHSTRDTRKRGPPEDLVDKVFSDYLKVKSAPTGVSGVPAEVVDKLFTDYLKVKKARMSAPTELPENKPTGSVTNSKISKREPLKMFLLSLLPDLEGMTDAEIRRFKRECLQAIDDALGSSED